MEPASKQPTFLGLIYHIYSLNAVSSFIWLVQAPSMGLLPAHFFQWIYNAMATDGTKESKHASFLVRP
jgi:hypothetical protein